MNFKDNWNKKKILNLFFVLIYIISNFIGVPCLIYTTITFEFAYIVNIITGASLFLVIFPTAFVLDAFLIIKKNKQWDQSLELTGGLVFQFIIAFVFSVISTWSIGSVSGIFLVDIIILSTTFVSMVSIVLVVIFVLYSYFSKK